MNFYGDFMSRLLSLFCILSIFLPCLLILTACKGEDDNPSTPDTPPGKDEEKAPELYIPVGGSFAGHSLENFSTFIYSAPNTEELLSALTLASERLKDEDITYESALSTVAAAEQVYANFMSMLSYAQIFYANNQKDSYFSGEYKRLYASMPQVAFAMEKLFSAVAASKHGAALAETDYFPSDIVERYKNGGIYTEQTIPLFEQENELLIAADAVSYDTVTITYSKLTDTVTNVLATLANTYGEASAEYQQAKTRCDTLYQKAANQKRAEIFLSLLSVRRDIADALGYESYAHFAAEHLGYSARKEDIFAVLSTVEVHMLPVYQELSAMDCFHSNTGKTEKIPYAEQTVNTLTKFYEAKGGTLFEGYNYLLQHGLFSIGNAGADRAFGAFASYLPNRAQPHLFVGMSGTSEDYIVTAGAVGDALYFYQNNQSTDAFCSVLRKPELSDAFNLSLRLLTLQGMKESLSNKDGLLSESYYTILLKNEMYNAFQITLTQCMRTQIEWEAYALQKDEISLQTVNEIVARAADRFDCFEIQDGAPTALSISTENLLDYDMLHTPTKSFSDVTSIYVALSIFSKEVDDSGAGFAVFESLLHADTKDQTYMQILSELFIPVPTDSEAARALASSLYEVLTGYSYRSVPYISPTFGKV